MPTTTWIHDDSRRLVGIIASNGDAAVYRYDAVGNITSVERRPASQLSIVEFVPSRGSIGTRVRIHGTGFATAAGIRVRFGAVYADVRSINRSLIVAEVPATAVTGRIRVEMGSGAVTTDRDFVVVDEGPPEITGVAPSVEVSGAMVRLRGRRLVTEFGSVEVELSKTLATVVSTTADSVLVEVPAPAASGHFKVRSPFGEASAPPDFFWVPPPYRTSEVESTTRLRAGVEARIAMSSPGHVALVIFDGGGGGRVSTVVRECSVARGQMQLYGPDGASVGDPIWIAQPHAFDGPRPLPLDGTYTLAVAPDDGITGALTLSVHEVPDDVVADAVIGGPTVGLRTAAPGQNIRVSFTATAGQGLSIALMAVLLSAPLGGAAISVLAADDTVIASDWFDEPQGSLNVGPIPTDASYTILLEPSLFATVSLTLALSAPVEVAATLDGGPVRVTTTSPGQSAHVRFDASAGATASVGLSAASFSDPDGAAVDVRAPDGTAIASRWLISDGDLDLPNLPATGTYDVAINPRRALTFDLKAAISTPVHRTGKIDGQAIQLATTAPGQDVRVAFHGGQGERITAKLSSVSFSPPGGDASVTVLAPSGASVRSGWITAPGADLPTQPLPDSGLYTIVINPQGGRTMRCRLALSTVTP